MIKVLTIDREFGSGATNIARKVAERLRWKLWDQALTDEIAHGMDCSCEEVQEREERRDPLHYRLFKAFMRGSFEGTINAKRVQVVDADCILTVTRNLVKCVAEEGHAVIVGRGAAYHLHERSDAYHVFVYAPFEEKVRRLKAMGRSEAEAMELAETVDRDRAEYIKQYFKVEWPDRHFFHLMVNTVVGDDMVVDTILDSVAMFEKQTA